MAQDLSREFFRIFKLELWNWKLLLRIPNEQLKIALENFLDEEQGGRPL